MQTQVRSAALDEANAEFWNELCGTGLARSLGIVDHGPESLRVFDEFYFGYYPYLADYVVREPLAGKLVLEIGLGFGSLGQWLASRGCRYHGLDVAENPVRMMRYRLERLAEAGTHRVDRGSALDIPHESGRFDYVYSIGCLHHTGDLPRAVAEVGRVLAPGGKAVVMLYNRRSLRQLAARLWRCWEILARRSGGPGAEGAFARALRALYDRNTAGAEAPHTDFVSPAEARGLFRGFSSVRVDVRNFDDHSLLGGRFFLPRKWFLNNLARFVGLDLYVVARK